MSQSLLSVSTTPTVSVTSQCICHLPVSQSLLSVSVTSRCLIHLPVVLSLLSVSVTSQCICHFSVYLSLLKASVLFQCICHLLVSLPPPSVSATSQCLCCFSAPHLPPKIQLHQRPNFLSVFLYSCQSKIHLSFSANSWRFRSLSPVVSVFSQCLGCHESFQLVSVSVFSRQSQLRPV